jgi:hypothetical protein
MPFSLPEISCRVWLLVRVENLSADAPSGERNALIALQECE